MGKEVSDELGIHPNQYYKWQSELFENGESAFHKTFDAHERRLLATPMDKLNRKEKSIFDLRQKRLEEAKQKRKDNNS